MWSGRVHCSIALFTHQNTWRVPLSLESSQTDLYNYILFDTDTPTMPEPSQVLPNSTDNRSQSAGLHQNTIFGSITSTIRSCGNITVCLLLLKSPCTFIMLQWAEPRGICLSVCYSAVRFSQQPRRIKQWKLQCNYNSTFYHARDPRNHHQGISTFSMCFLFGKAWITLSVQLAGCSKPHWRCLNLKSKQQITLSRRFSSSKALNSLFFVGIHI